VIAATIGVIVLVAMVRKRLSKSATSTHTKLEVSATGLTVIGADANVKLEWSAFGDCVESPDLFVLLDRPKAILFAIPKRAFPSESRQNWFRMLTENRLKFPEPVPIEAPALVISPSADSIRLRVQLGFRDYLDRTIASSFTWALLLFFAGLFIGVGVYAAANPPPDAVFSATEMLFFFEIPFLLVMAAFLVLVITVHGWFTHRKYLTPQEMALSEDSIVFSGVDSQGSLPWTSYTRFKETPWSFIVWKPGGLAWLMLPKRMFQSADDLARCRALLARKLTNSRWYFA
jgi:hypothetical protein